MFDYFLFIVGYVCVLKARRINVAFCQMQGLQTSTVLVPSVLNLVCLRCCSLFFLENQGNKRKSMQFCCLGLLVPNARLKM